MTDIKQKILELIKQNMNMKEIAREVNITEKQLYVRIKQIINYGSQVKPTYNFNSDIYYSIVRGVKEEDEKFSIAIPKKEKNFKCLVISDLHIGNIESDLNLLKVLYEYASKTGINYILNCGDLIEGNYTTDKKSIKNLEDQLEFLIKKHPYDKNINNIVIFGNHDYHSLKYEGLDMAKLLGSYRYDIIPIGYGQGSVNLRNDSLVLFHRLSESSSPMILNDEKIVLSGHGHMMKTKVRDQLWLCIPSLSYVSVDKTKDVIPGFVELSIDFEKGKFEYIEAKHMVITPKIITASETRCRVKCLGRNGN